LIEQYLLKKKEQNVKLYITHERYWQCSVWTANQGSKFWDWSGSCFFQRPEGCNSLQRTLQIGWPWLSELSSI